MCKHKSTFNNLYTNPTDQQIGRLITYLEIFNSQKPEKSIFTLLANVFRLYAQAMDARFRHDCFLSLWQIAENLLLAEEFGGNTKTISKRLKHFSSYISTYAPGINYTIEYLAEKRNSIVHKGETDVSDEEIKIIKMHCDILMKWIIDKSSKLKTISHLSAYYRLKDKSHKEITVLRDTLDFILESSQ